MGSVGVVMVHLCLLCSDNDSALVLILFRDTDGRMLLDIFDENLHPLSVS